MFNQNSVQLAQKLIGQKLTQGDTSGIIVETEAYPGEKDPACHYNGKSTKRGKVFEKGPGTVYVFSMHGHNCLNFICGSEEYPEGVLIRALKPENGIQKMEERRGKEKSLCDGPGKLTEAMNISKREMNEKRFSETNLELEQAEDEKIMADRRIGISSAETWPLRFCMKSSEHISSTLKDPVDSEEAKKFVRNLME